MKDLTTQTGIIVKCSKTAIEFFQNAQSVDFFSALEIPKEFQDIAVEFYDLIMENDHLAALLGCRGNYDIAIQIDEVTGTIWSGGKGHPLRRAVGGAGPRGRKCPGSNSGV